MGNANETGRRRGRPRIHPDKRAAQAAASRAYRKRQKRKVYHRSDSDEWYTPPDLAQMIMRNVAHRRDEFDLDPCSPEHGPYTVEAARRYTQEENGLTRDWGEAGDVVWVNPPYSQMAAWIEKMIEQAGRGVVIIALVPARTDTRWWARATADAEGDGHRTAIDMPIEGRVKFWRARPDGTIEPGESAPFPSAVLLWNAEDIDI